MSPGYSSTSAAGSQAPRHAVPTRHHKRSRSENVPDTGTSSNSSRSASRYYVSSQRRDQNEYRSFLSLDLAESTHHRSLTKPDTSSKKDSYWLIPPVPPLSPFVSPLESHFSSACSLRSEDSLRSVPSPKPAPSIMLPKIPDSPYSKQKHYRRSAPRLPELPVLPALQFILPPPRSKFRPHPQQPLPSPPLSLSPLSPSPPPSPFSSDLTPDTTLFSPPTDSSQTPFSPSENDDPFSLRSSVLTKPKHLRSKKPKNLHIITNPNEQRFSKASISTVSTRVRRRNRWEALDTLEGRRKPLIGESPFVQRNLQIENVFVRPTTFAPPTPFSPRPESSISKATRRVPPNFMSMSDDSDSEPEFNPYFEPEDIVLPVEASTFKSTSYPSVELGGDVEEGVVLEATRYALLQSPSAPVGPMPVVQPQPQPQLSSAPVIAPWTPQWPAVRRDMGEKKDELMRMREREPVVGKDDTTLTVTWAEVVKKDEEKEKDKEKGNNGSKSKYRFPALRSRSRR